MIYNDIMILYHIVIHRVDISFDIDNIIVLYHVINSMVNIVYDNYIVYISIIIFYPITLCIAYYLFYGKLPHIVIVFFYIFRIVCS